MKQLFTIALFLLMLVGINNEAKASHFAGADLTYRCIGGNTYEVTVTFYRDCSGVDAPSSVDINMNCPSNAMLTFTASLPMVGGGVEITPSCSASPTTCVTGPPGSYGIAEYVYRGKVNLPNCNNWQIEYTSGARNPVSTITGAGNWYVPGILNTGSAKCNNSPTFTNKPVALACVNEPYVFNNGAQDVDGDSLSYSFYAPMTTALTNTVNYMPPYSYTNFVMSSTPIRIDPLTGDITLTPTMVQTSAFGVRVDEWRKIKGVITKIGSIFRDIQINVVACSNSTPTLSGMDTLLTKKYDPTDTVFFIQKCWGNNDTIKFNIHGNDLDTFSAANSGSPEKFKINWNNGIPAAHFNSYYNNTDSAYASFSWLPAKSDISLTPRCFTATVQDGGCPYNASSTFSYCIVVRGMEVNLPSDTLLCSGESMDVTTVADTTTVNYKWSLDGNSVGQNQDNFVFNSSDYSDGNHILSIETNDGATTTACPGKDNMKIDVVYQPKIRGVLSDTAVCAPSDVTFDAGPGQLYMWSNLTAGTVVGSTQLFTNHFSSFETAKYKVEVDGGQYTRCKDVDTFLVASIAVPNLGPDTCIWTTEAPITLDAGFINPDDSYLWGDGTTQKTIQVNNSGKYKVSINNKNIKPSISCSDEVTVSVVDKDNYILSIPYMSGEDTPIPGSSYQPGDQTICAGQSLGVKGPVAPSGAVYKYIWSQDGKIVDTNQTYTLRAGSVGAYTLSLSSGTGCENEINVTAENCDVDVPNVITPNNDGQNDVFKITLKGSDRDFFESFPKSELLIYNRWGKKVFESNNYQNDWGGDNLADGVYFWTLRLANDKKTEIRGTVTKLSQ